MPSDSTSFRAICGCFVWKFWIFMFERAKSAVSVQVKTRTARAKCVLLAVIVASLLMCSGNIHPNPGPGVENSASMEGSDDFSGVDKDLKALLCSMFDQQQQRMQASFDSVTDQLSSVQESLCALGQDVRDLYARTTKLEEDVHDLRGVCQEATSAVSFVEERLEELEKNMEEKVDRLESFSRRDNLKFFGIAESVGETYTACAQKVVDTLQNTVPEKDWSLSDIIRAHRLGPQRPGNVDSTSRPRPLIARFLRWSDKMEVLTKGREGLKQKGVKVASDLTTRQQWIIKEHRDQGLYAHFKGDRLIVTGPIQRADHTPRVGPLQPHCREDVNSVGNNTPAQTDCDSDHHVPKSYADTIRSPANEVNDARGSRKSPHPPAVDKSLEETRGRDVSGQQCGDSPRPPRSQVSATSQAHTHSTPSPSPVPPSLKDKHVNSDRTEVKSYNMRERGQTASTSKQVKGQSRLTDSNSGQVLGHSTRRPSHNKNRVGSSQSPSRHS